MNRTTSHWGNNSSVDNNADDCEDCDARTQISQNSPTPSVDTQPAASGAQETIQMPVNSFFKACESEKTEESPLDKIQDAVNEIVVKLDETISNIARIGISSRRVEHYGRNYY